jgi:hypothetical protein
MEVLNIHSPVMLLQKMNASQAAMLAARKVGWTIADRMSCFVVKVDKTSPKRMKS